MVGEKLFAVRESQLDRLHVHVNVFGRIVPHLLQVESLENAESEQLGRPLVGRRVFVNVVSPVAVRNRLLDLDLVGSKIAIAEQAAIGFREFRHLPRDVTFVETVAGGLQTLAAAHRGLLCLGLNKPLKRACQTRVPEDFTWGKRLAIWDDKSSGWSGIS